MHQLKFEQIFDEKRLSLFKKKSKIYDFCVKEIWFQGDVVFMYRNKSVFVKAHKNEWL